MKRLITLLGCLWIFNQGYSQHHLYLGARTGVGYSSDWSKRSGLIFGSDYSPSLQVMQTHTLKTKINAVGTGLKAEILYGYKIFRVGYQFDYLFVRGVNYVSKLTPPETAGGRETFAGKSKLEAGYIGNSLLLEITAFQKKQFSISPNMSIGYFTRVPRPYISSINYFQAGAGLMFGFEVKGITLFINPDYAIRWSGENFGDERLVHSALLNFGIRGDMLSLRKTKDK